MALALTTIGYARATQASLIEALKEAGVEVLADIRALPNSRRAGFSKSSLRAAAHEAGMEYRHFKHLGTPKEGRDAARRGDYPTLRRVYEGQLELPEALAQMAEIQALAREQRVCLLCYCEEAERCHRSLLIEQAFADTAITHLHAG
ncbi:DUF488 domain-containing protein [Aurantiacibacter spongiae]|uniref:DUF488 domain-containing protein n=1 Tax=Aurantiacibacter spongiae TaxID=2488860 RepID=A0A3N5CUW8_9SPHN|nr:DUF488 domain-containing protein [Aurantiacibacter spongiae]RPF72537.1 DUF488 domain-containing protein [Aurantiacibacter spongiae]